MGNYVLKFHAFMNETPLYGLTLHMQHIILLVDLDYENSPYLAQLF